MNITSYINKQKSCMQDSRNQLWRALHGFSNYFSILKKMVVGMLHMKSKYTKFHEFFAISIILEILGVVFREILRFCRYFYEFQRTSRKITIEMSGTYILRWACNSNHRMSKKAHAQSQFAWSNFNSMQKSFNLIKSDTWRLFVYIVRELSLSLAGRMDLSVSCKQLWLSIGSSIQRFVSSTRDI